MGARGDDLIRPAVVLCPPLTRDTPVPPWHDDLARRLARLGTPTLRPSVDHTARGPAPGSDVGSGPPDPSQHRLALAAWVADQAVALTAAGVDQPLILVASGPATAGLPALGFSQRASRRSVVTYVMVDGPLPQAGPATGDWPDAPVVCVQHASTAELDAAVTTGARLRGWTVVHEAPAAAISRLVQRWPDPL